MIVFLVYFCMLFFGLQAQDKISLYNNANVLHGAGKFVEAEQVFNQVLKSDLSEEEKEQAYFNLGCSQAEQKKYQEAIKSFEEVAKVNEENLRAKKNIEILKKLEQKQKQEQKQEQKQKQDKKQEQEESNKSNQEKDQSNKDADKDNPDKSSDDKKTDVDKGGANKPSQHEDSKKDSNKNNKDNVKQEEPKDQESDQEEQEPGEQEGQEQEEGGEQESPLNAAEQEIAAAVDKCDTNIGKHRKAMLKGHDYGW